MHEWAMTYPYLAFFIMLFTILLVNNLVVGLVKMQPNDNEAKDKHDKSGGESSNLDEDI